MSMWRSNQVSYRPILGLFTYFIISWPIAKAQIVSSIPWTTNLRSSFIKLLDIRTSEKRFYRKITDIYATSIDNDPSGDTPKKEELEIAKNHLSFEELTQLNARIWSLLPSKLGAMHMKDWIYKLHGFLQINDRNILQGSGKVAHEEMLVVVDQEYQRAKQARLHNFSRF